MKHLKQWAAGLLCAALVLSLFSGCGKTKTKTGGDESLSVVCSIFPVYDFCREVMGSDEHLTLLLDTKTDLHNYVPDAPDIAALAEADVFFYIGGESDGWVDATLESANNKDLMSVALINAVGAVEETALPGMEEEKEEEEEADEGPELDEHIWASLKNAQKMVEAITESLAKADADNAETYRANSAAYLEKLASLEQQYQSTVESAKRKTLLFADRFPFRYLQADYDLECYAAFSGCAAGGEAGTDTITYLISVVKDKALPYILVIDGSTSEFAKYISSETGAEIRMLNSCQSVGEVERENGMTYLSAMTENLAVLKEVLN